MATPAPKPVEQLFDDAIYYVPSGLIEQLGEIPGTRLLEPRYVDVLINHVNPQLYVASFEEGEYASIYDTGDYSDMFATWDRVRKPLTKLSGYLAGFPVLVDPDTNAQVKCLHIWENNSDIAGSSAVPVHSVSRLGVYTRLYTKLQMDLDEQAMGAEPRYEVPMLRKKATGEFIYRDADPDTVQRAIESLAEIPITVFVGDYGHPQTASTNRLLFDNQIHGFFKF